MLSEIEPINDLTEDLDEFDDSEENKETKELLNYLDTKGSVDVDHRLLVSVLKEFLDGYMVHRIMEELMESDFFNVG